MRILAWLLAAGPALWAVLRLGGLDRAHPLVAAMAFTPHVAAASVLVVAALAALRRWLPLALAAVATLALGAAVLPRALGDPEAGGPHLRVLTVNAAVGAVPAEAIAEVVRERRVDLLSVQELTPDLDAELRDVLPHAVTRPEAGATGTGLYSRHPLRELPPPAGGPFAQTAARLDWEGGFEVVSVHPPPPVSAQHVDGWHETFDGLPRADRPRILAGDFNATLDHHALRELIGSGFTDAADATGDGLRATWPANRGGLRPGIAIDHVLVTQDLVAVRTEIVGLPRGDHRAVFAELVARASTG
jgi:endonuclease/exonuclease/phosphatase (EEP) superfamily protein YafD